MMKAMRIFERLKRDRSGVAAVEFALIALPFFMLIFAIIEIAVMYLVDAALDSALHKSVRQVRVGTAAAGHWDINAFKAALCGNLVLPVNCSDNVMVRATVISDMNSVNRVSGIQDGKLAVTESFDIGVAGDYVLIQVFLPWTTVMQYYSYSSARLSDGSYALTAAELFKNEPF